VTPILRQSSRSGFSLLEAIVALTLISTIGLAIFSWVSGMLISVEKIENNGSRLTVMRNAAEYLSNTNIMEQPSGNAILGPYQLSWNSELVEPIKTGLNSNSTANEFKVGLYDVNVSVVNANHKEVQFTLRLTGFHGEEALPF
jgi:general secretion pathway protein I